MPDGGLGAITAALRRREVRQRQQIGRRDDADDLPTTVVSGMTVTRKTPNLDNLLTSLSRLRGAVFEVRGISELSKLKLATLKRDGRDFIEVTPAMEQQVVRFMRGALSGGARLSINQLLSTVPRAIKTFISLRLRNGGNDVRSRLRPLSRDYAAYKRQRFPNSPGIGYASGDLARDFDANAVVVVVSR